MSEMTLEQLDELRAQARSGRVTRENLQRFLLNPNGGSANIIDTDAVPFLPAGWKVEEHRRGGQLLCNPTKVSLYLFAKQRGKGIIGHELRKELADKPVLNANVLDYLLAHPELIPEEWKGKAIYFWGTIYCHIADGYLCVRYLYWDGDRWFWGYGWLDDDWREHGPAAVESVPA